MKHTPGPWSFSTNDRGEFCINGKPATETDARLVAFAPLMLEALYHAMITAGREGANADVNHPLRNVWENCREVIAKAMGGEK